MGTGVSGLFKLLKAIGEAADAVQQAARAPLPGEQGADRSRAQRVEDVLEELNAGLDARRRTRKQSDRTARTTYYNLSRELRDAIRGVLHAEWKANRPIRERYEEVARRLKHERNLLRIEPHREPLLDPEFAGSELARDRLALEAILRARSADMEQVVADYRERAASEAHALDPSGRLAADWQDRIEFESRDAKRAVAESVAKTSGVLDYVDTELAALRDETAQNASGPSIASTDREVLGSLRYDAPLGPDDLHRLAGAILNPRSKALKRLIDTVLTDRPERGYADRPSRPLPLPEGLTAAERAQLASECFERAVAIDALIDQGYDRGDWFERAAAAEHSAGRAGDGASAVSALSLVRGLCNRLLRGIEPGSVEFRGEDAERLGRALVLASECRQMPEAAARRSRAPLAVGFRPLEAFDLDPAKAADRAGLVDRLEAAAHRTIGRPLSDRQAGSFAFHHFALLAALRRAIGLPRGGPSAEAWDAYLAQRRERRAEIVGKVSPFWRPLFERLIDLPRSGGLEEAKILRAAFDPFAAMDMASRAQVLDEVRALRADVRVSNSWDLVSRADDEQEVRPTCYGWGGQVLFRLEELLSRPAEEQATYFAPPPGLPPLGDFAPMSLSFAGDVRDNIVDREIVPLIVDANFEQADVAVRLWLERAPPSPLRDVVLATSWKDMSLTGWERVARWIAQPDTSAIGLDISGHVTSELHAADQPVPFEAGRYSDTAHAFSSATRAELQALGRSGRAPWRGAFDDVDVALPIVGLTPVLLALRTFQRAPRYDWSAELRQVHGAVERLVLAWCFLCANRLVARDLQSLRLPREVPFLVGDHSFGLFPTVVHMPMAAGASATTDRGSNF